MANLTSITTPFGLLDDETRMALSNSLETIQGYYLPGVWKDLDRKIVGFYFDTVYRVKPAPIKPREWWMVGPTAKGTRTEAQDFLDRLHKDNPEMGFDAWRVVHVREVME
jgi:hypothetical protein